MQPVSSAWRRLIASLVLAAACGGAETGGPTPPAPPPPPPPTPVASVEVAPPGSPVLVGAQVQLSAIPRSAAGAALSGRTVAWRSDHPVIASVGSTTGLVTGHVPGSATIVATAEGVSGTVQVTVVAVAARVVLDRDTAVVQLGATLQLAAEVQDAEGDVIAGRTVAWTTTAPTVATVSATGVVTAAQTGQARIVATVDAVADTVLVVVAPGPLVLTLGTAAAVTRTVGPAGDTLRTTAPDGTGYTLVIPPAALEQPVAITMTPITAAQGVPLSGGLAGGVDLKPSGTSFLFPATLSISTSRTPGAGQQLVGIAYSGTGDQVQLATAEASGGVISIPVSHFSGAGAGFGTAQDIATLYLSQRLDATNADSYVAGLVNAAASTPRDPLAELGIYLAWFDHVVLPRMKAVTTDAQLAGAIAVYNSWTIAGDRIGLSRSVPQGESHPDWASRRGQWRTDAAGKLKDAIRGNLALCAQPGLASARVTALDNALFWYRLASWSYNLATAEYGLDLAWLTANLCATVVAEGVTLADPLASGPNPLTLTFKLSFPGGQVTLPANFFVTPTLTSGSGTLPTATAESPPGYYEGTVIPTGAGAAQLTLRACYAGSPRTIFLLLGDPNEVCGVTLVERGGTPEYLVRHHTDVRFSPEPESGPDCSATTSRLAGLTANLSESGACRIYGLDVAGRASLAGSATQMALEAEVSRSSGSQEAHEVTAQAFSTLTDRVVITGPGLAGTQGVIRFRLEVTGSVTTTGPCTPILDMIEARWTIQTRLQPQLQPFGGGSQQAFATVRGLAGPCAGQTTGPVPPVSLVSNEVTFTYGAPIYLFHSLALFTETRRPSPGQVPAASARGQVTFRWLGIQGLPPGATVTSATGIDWNRPAPP
ncbi:MAG: Ig-like domain-containing protein [Gemmatimonadales bacterium]|nr:Ig-like domain-containing protein [Gemmatimonadales bacterium]